MKSEASPDPTMDGQGGSGFGRVQEDVRHPRGQVLADLLIGGDLLLRKEKVGEMRDAQGGEWTCARSAQFKDRQYMQGFKVQGFEGLRDAGNPAQAVHSRI
eukprot:scaffold212019_cov22-Tisochrysis_lutea.AAC.3